MKNRSTPYKDASLTCGNAFDAANNCICCGKPANKKRKIKLVSTQNGMMQLKAVS